MRKFKRTPTVTLIELVMAIALLGVIILGAVSFEMASRYFLRSSKRKLKLLNEMSYILEHISLNVKIAIGDNNNPGIIMSSWGWSNKNSYYLPHFLVYYPHKNNIGTSKKKGVTPTISPCQVNFLFFLFEKIDAYLRLVRFMPDEEITKFWFRHIGECPPLPIIVPIVVPPIVVPPHLIVEFRLRHDVNNTPYDYTDDKWVRYVYNDSTNKLFFYADAFNSTHYEVLSERVHSFIVDSFGNRGIKIEQLTLRYNPDAKFDPRTNPEVTVNNVTFISFSHSIY